MLFTKGCVRSPPPPTRATHGRCVLCHLCRELWRGCAQVCTVRFRLCTVCTVCRMSLSPDGGFQRVFCEVCAHLQNVSDSVAELDAPRESSLTDSDESVRVIRKKQLRKGFQPGEQKRALAPNPGAFSVRGRPGADLAGFGQIWRPGGYSN